MHSLSRLNLGLLLCEGSLDGSSKQLTTVTKFLKEHWLTIVIINNKMLLSKIIKNV